MKISKHLFIVIVLLLSVQLLPAQNSYTNHILKSGETLSTLAKEYNTNVGDIMRINGMHADAKLVYGSTIKIPSNKSTPKETTTAKTVEKQTAALPSNVFVHTVVKGETLFSLSKKYNISTTQLKTLNKLSDNNVKVGSTILIAKGGVNESVAEKKQPVEPAPQAKVPEANAAAASTPPVETTPAQSGNVSPSNNTAQPNNNATSQSASVEQNTIQQNAIDNNAVVAEQKNDMAAAEDNNTASTSNKNNNGYFADLYQKSRRQKHLSGMSKTFKTASGWKDSKYYILANDVNPGTIVKLTTDNGNSVYAKVLWSMGDMKENNGLNFRVSDATAAALKENDQQFNLTLTY